MKKASTTNSPGQATTSAKMALTSSKSSHLLPLKSKRYFSEMNLLLLIFVGCCSCLILWPQTTSAASVSATAADSTMQDFGSVTAKGENIFMLASSIDDLGNAFPGEIQGDSSSQDDEDEGDATNVGKMPLMPNARKEHVPTEDIEMMQRSPQSHNPRHQEHYKQRIMSTQQQQQAMESNDLKPQPEKELVNNRQHRYQQIQQALREPITPMPRPQSQQQHHHHGHHDRHHRHQEEFNWPLPQHSSRPHHHQSHLHLHHHQREHLRHHRRHNFTATATTTTSTSTTLRPRYFDRDGLYTNPLAWIPTTQGPLHLDETKTAPKRPYNPHNHLFNDEDMEVANSQQEETKQEEEFKRISLSLDANKESSTGNDNKLFDALSFDNDDEDDYSYEDDKNEEGNDDDMNSNRSPPVVVAADNGKINVKRYTTPLRAPYKTLTSSYSSSSRKRQQHSNKNSYDGNTSEDYESNDEESNDDNDNFSDEKWNKIEHEHYRKQQQHQRAMQALRSRRPQSASSSSASSSGMDNSPNSVIGKNKYSSPSKSASTAKRPILNEDDTDNIYSRYYVPGSVTRKKEEELSSPTAVLESRRQYALQQRQNKAFATAHHRRIVKEGSCRVPQPRVERIHRDSWKIYTPHCTILHRCADDTGCCPTERQTCAPKRTKNVDLYFFVITLNETQGSIERLTFVNHTECHCVDKAKQRSAMYDSDESTSEIASNHIPYLRRATILNCNCPNLYEKILQEDGFCRCDCSSGNMGCDWLKRGMEHFSMNDRKCISEGRCKLPTCEYGSYMKKLGRCPRREERQVSLDTVDW